MPDAGVAAGCVAAGGATAAVARAAGPRALAAAATGVRPSLALPAAAPPGANASMRNRHISKPTRGVGASGRSRRPVTAIWYHSCTSCADSSAANLPAAASADAATSWATCTRCSRPASSSSTWAKSGAKPAMCSISASNAAASPRASATSSCCTLARSTVPSIACTSLACSVPPPWAIAWSSKDSPSRSEPSAAMASVSMASASKPTCSASRMCRIWPLICSGDRRLRLNLMQRDSTVTGNFCGSVVASRNLTWGGGSSSVLSSALKALRESMCTSSIR